MKNVFCNCLRQLSIDIIYAISLSPFALPVSAEFAENAQKGQKTAKMAILSPNNLTPGNKFQNVSRPFCSLGSKQATNQISTQSVNPSCPQFIRRLVTFDFFDLILSHISKSTSF